MYTRFRHEVIKFVEFEVSESDVTIHKDVLSRIEIIKKATNDNQDRDLKIEALLKRYGNYLCLGPWALGVVFEHRCSIKIFEKSSM